MSDLFSEVKAKVQGMLGSWAAISALGSFVLYLFGYLALRFHLTTLGIGTDLAVIDERYFFTGAKFLIYLLCSIPIILLIALALALPVFVAYQIVLYVRRKRSEKSGQAPKPKIPRKLPSPFWMAFAALVVSVILIQFVMRQCFLFGNLLLTPALPTTTLNLHQLLFDTDGGIRSLYFSALLGSTILTAALLFYAVHRSRTVFRAKAVPRPLLIVGAALVAIQFLLLPVNYGVFILEKEIPKVTTLGDDLPLPAGHEAWLVWEGNEGRTYLIQTTTAALEGQNSQERKLVTVPRKDFKKIEIVRYDEIIKYLFEVRTQ